jgi:hypothetical protein
MWRTRCTCAASKRVALETAYQPTGIDGDMHFWRPEDVTDIRAD